MLGSSPGQNVRPQRLSRAVYREDFVKIGYFLCSEEWGPGEQLEQARMAEETGFDALWIFRPLPPME
jgi:hypothetical protein